MAELELNRPVTAVEIAMQLQHMKLCKPKDLYWLQGIMTSLVREDKVFFNEQTYSHFSTTTREGYSKFTDLFQRKFKGYKIRTDHTIGCLAETRILNFKRQITMLKST